jgi:hypothetical protein
MRFPRLLRCALLLILASASLGRGQLKVSDRYLIVNAEGNDPLFTTYAAAMPRSRFFADKAYFMDYFSPETPVNYSSQYAGRWGVVWKVNNLVIHRKVDFARKPVVEASFPDMVLLRYELLPGLHVQECFCVYSSGAALIDLRLENRGSLPFSVFAYPVLLQPGDSLRLESYDNKNRGVIFTHYESLTRPHSNLYAGRDYPTHFRNILASRQKPDSFGGYPGYTFDDFYYAAKRLSKAHAMVRKLNERGSGSASLIALQRNDVLNPGETVRFRFVRACRDARQDRSLLFQEAGRALEADLQSLLDANVALFRSVPRIRHRDPGEKMIYLGGFNLVRQCMLPPRDKTRYNYYVFSRNPVWGWGHGHQVMHESLSMLAYVFLDPVSAQASQMVYMEQQYEDGLIGYRHGPRGPQVYPHEGKATTSAPFFSWTNWEIYRVGRDRAFLRKSYEAGQLYVNYLMKERDKDGDGLLEWGPYGIIENVRDGWNAVFQLFSGGEDEGRDISDELEALDLCVQVANEMRWLREMALELGDRKGAEHWDRAYRRMGERINKTHWDPEDGFYYHTAMEDNTFRFEGESLQRKEIIGFLPMWAGIAGKDRVRSLVKHLTDPDTFWRPFGVPTLAADDPRYTPFVDGCCRWNGPVWLLWDYMVFRGLLDYGYREQAEALAGKMVQAVRIQLENNHRFWESYSPDFTVLECPSNYIWDSIISRLLIDLHEK